MADGTDKLAAVLGDYDALNKGDLAPKPDQKRQTTKKNDSANYEIASHPFDIVDPRVLHGAPIPQREWIIPGWLPVGSVTALYGDGGTGKTLLAQQLMTSTALGARFCGQTVTRCRSLGFFCEDSQAELHRRQAAICDAYGCSFDDLGDMAWVSGVGEDNTLQVLFGDRLVTTDLYDKITAACIVRQVKLLVLDTAADLFGGNENDRPQVRRFIGALTRLALEIGGAVLLNAHPSRSGLRGGDIDGGSTAWNNSVRSRWSLSRPEIVAGETPDSDARVLTRRKANYAGIGDKIDLVWRDGVLAVSGDGVGFGAAARAEVEVVFLDLLVARTASNLPVSHSPRAQNYAPRVFAQSTLRRGYTQRDFVGALHRLLDARRIIIEDYGRPGDRRSKIVLAPVEKGGGNEV